MKDFFLESWNAQKIRIFVWKQEKPHKKGQAKRKCSWNINDGVAFKYSDE